MLKKRSIRKILASSSVVVAMLLVYLVPKNTEYSLDIKKTVEYKDTDVTFQTVYLLDQNDYVARSKIVSNKSMVIGGNITTNINKWYDREDWRLWIHDNIWFEII